MNNLSNPDKKLLDRIIALRPSTFLSNPYDCTPSRAKLASNLLDSSITRTQLKNTQDDLSIRLRKLRDVSFTPPENPGNTLSPTKLKQDSKEIDINFVNNQLASEELEISPGQISVECDKLTKYDDLLTEISSGIQNDLKKVEKSVSIPSLNFIEPEQNEINNEALISLLDNMPFELECDEDDKQDENEQFIAQIDFSSEVNDVIAQVMDEVSLEKAQPLQQKDDKNKPQDEKLEIKNEDLFKMPIFPSIPTSLCHPKKTFNGSSKVHLNQKPKVSAESPCGMSPIDLKSFQPLEKPILQLTEICKEDFKDSDLDTWCIICLDNARIRCLSCDGDLYCASCWEEGHTGPDAGLEERNHNWLVYKR